MKSGQGVRKMPLSGLVTQDSRRLSKQTHWGHQPEMFLLAQGTGMLPSPDAQLAACITECRPAPGGGVGWPRSRFPLQMVELQSEYQHGLGFRRTKRAGRGRRGATAMGGCGRRAGPRGTSPWQGWRFAAYVPEGFSLLLCNK